MTVPVPVIPAIPEPVDPLKLTLPGGITLSSIPSVTDGVLTAFDQVQSLLTQLGPGIAAASPIFSMVKAINSTLDLVTAVITGDPEGVISALEDAAVAASELGALAPVVAVPLMAAGVVRLIIGTLGAITVQLNLLLAAQEAALNLIDQATTDGDQLLLAVANASRDQNDQLVEHLCASLGPVGELVSLFNSLIGLVPGLEPLPLIPDCGGLRIDEFIAEVQRSTDEFNAVDAPPVPPVTPPLPVTPKAGVVLVSQLTGSPPSAMVIFGQRFPLPNYALTFNAVMAAGAAAPAIGASSKFSTGFVISLGTSDKSGLIAIDWQAIVSGEVA